VIENKEEIKEIEENVIWLEKEGEKPWWGSGFPTWSHKCFLRLERKLEKICEL
jgi:hypothetical protein